VRVYSPVTTLGRTIIVHAKLTIIDDILLRIGSANINNRSFGFDTERDLSLEAASAEKRAEILRLRNALLAHWLGGPPERLDAAITKHGGVGAALETLRTGGYCRLRPITPKPLNPVAAFVAAFHLGDPVGPNDSWRPWRRKGALRQEAVRGRAAAGSPAIGPSHSPPTPPSFQSGSTRAASSAAGASPR
jgi:phosphatidylserine/phosphatidylglycerophosphate/cardiolipin synthase-like enzyme